jgi:hypothetical protein
MALAIDEPGGGAVEALGRPSSSHSKPSRTRRAGIAVAKDDPEKKI